MNRPRSDLYIQHFLASKKGEGIPIKHLFNEYKSWVERKVLYPSVEAELVALSRQATPSVESLSRKREMFSSNS